MECPNCGRYAPPDPDTGYDADEICPDCSRDGWTLDADGRVVNEGKIVRVVLGKDDGTETPREPIADLYIGDEECPF